MLAARTFPPLRGGIKGGVEPRAETRFNYNIKSPTRGSI